jgi:hypothetical protein
MLLRARLITVGQFCWLTMLIRLNTQVFTTAELLHVYFNKGDELCSGWMEERLRHIDRFIAGGLGIDRCYGY